MGEKIFFVLCFLHLSCSILARPRNLSEDENANKSIFILAGQSNMAGRAKDDNNINPPECRPNPRILSFAYDLKWVMAKNPLHAHIDIKRPVGIGPGIPFAHTILESAGSRIGTIGLVPCAHGGTNIIQWGKGTDHYNQLVTRANASLKEGGTIRALLWYQGESDTEKLEDAIPYKGRLEQFFCDVRSDLGLPDLPVLLVAIKTGNRTCLDMIRNRTCLDMIRKAQFEINLPNVIVVDAAGAEVIPTDRVHLNMAGAIDMGKRLANAFLQRQTIC